jgi:hypothetical protein
VGEEVDLAMSVDGRHIKRDPEMLDEVAGEDRLPLGVLRDIQVEPLVEAEAEAVLLGAARGISDASRGQLGRVPVKIDDRHLLAQVRDVAPGPGHAPLAHARVADQQGEDALGGQLRGLDPKFVGRPGPPNERDVPRHEAGRPCCL